MLIGYARVSSRTQETALQLDALQKAGVQKIYQEKARSIGDRPQLRLALASMQKGDVLLVWKLDRVARSLRDLLGILETLQQRGAGFRSLTEPIDTSSSVGMFIVQILGAVGQFERNLIRERAIAGQVAAWQRGVRWGGQPRALSDADAQEVYLLRSTGLFTKSMLAEMFDCSESTVTRAFVARRFPERVTAKKTPVLGRYLNGSGRGSKSLM
ncbi:recombinase family protein [Polaromonas aquatica]|uniref:recombinase family protein n=1 Tax=Polaromonas aquatica TaxID=332657 RepID=UPI003D64DEF8